MFQNWIFLWETYDFQIFGNETLIIACYEDKIFPFFTKVRFKYLWTKFWDLCCYSAMYQIFYIQIAFQSSDRVELDVWGSVIKISLNFESQRTKEVELSSQGPATFKFWEMKLLLVLITNIFKFAMLDIKFANSVIIHQSNGNGIAGFACMHLDTKWNTGTCVSSCFHLASDGKEDSYLGKWNFLPNHVPDESTDKMTDKNTARPVTG